MVKTDWSPEFLRFWAAYPKRWVESSSSWVKIGKELAWVQWERLSADDKEWAMFAVGKEHKGKFVPDAHRWLRDKKFRDFDRTTTPLRDTRKPEPVAVEMKFNDARRDAVNKLTRDLSDKMKG